MDYTFSAVQACVDLSRLTSLNAKYSKNLEVSHKHCSRNIGVVSPVMLVGVLANNKNRLSLDHQELICSKWLQTVTESTSVETKLMLCEEYNEFQDKC